MLTVSDPLSDPVANSTARRERDIRLDFFRGLGMFIIFIAHVPDNPWSRWIPARFGFSDATEIFVFCSGMASAIAFAKVFDQSGMAIGTARILHRCWQVYWAHVSLFVVAVACMVFADRMLETGNHFQNMVNMVHFVTTDTGAGILGLLTLTYVPNLFDILPMYLIILLMIPAVMALSRVHPSLAMAVSVVIWVFGTAGYFEFSAEPWSARRWFFHPLAWQLVFFTGFAFIRGWIPAPPITPRLVALAIFIVFAIFCLVTPSVTPLLPLPESWTRMPQLVIDKTRFGLLRYIHFMALAYLAYAAAGPAGVRLKGHFVDVCRRVGQQTLAVFMAGIIFALCGAVALDRFGRGFIPVTLVNIIGCLALVAVAYVVAWFKASPWKTRQPMHALAPSAL